MTDQDLADPVFWYGFQLRALAGLQRGDKAPASQFLAFVAQHRGRPVAEATREALLRYSRGRVFSDARSMFNRWSESNPTVAARLPLLPKR